MQWGLPSEIAHQIQAQGADYVLALKANHPTLYAQVKQWFQTAQAQKFEGIEHSYDVRVESGHHRREKRQITAVPLNQMGDLYKQAQWSGLQTIVRVVRLSVEVWARDIEVTVGQKINPRILNFLPGDGQQVFGGASL